MTNKEYTMENSKLLYRKTYNNFIRDIQISFDAFFKSIPRNTPPQQMKIRYCNFHDNLKVIAQKTFSPLNQAYEINFQPQINKINQYIEDNKSTISYTGSDHFSMITQTALNFKILKDGLDSLLLDMEKTDLVPALMDRNESMKMEKK